MTLDEVSHLTSMAAEHLAERTIHVWGLYRRELDLRSTSALETLSDDEQRRGLGYKTYELQRDFMNSRRIVRAVLAGYCLCNPRDLIFKYGEFGKPSLLGMPRLKRVVSFNISHSDEILVVAVAKEGKMVGVDIERIERGVGIIESSAEAFLSSDEHAYLSKIGQRRDLCVLLKYWTYKEAYLKAFGYGLSLDPRQVQIEARSDVSAVLSAPNKGHNMKMLSRVVVVDRSYACAIASDEKEPRFIPYLCW